MSPELLPPLQVALGRNQLGNHAQNLPLVLRNKPHLNSMLFCPRQICTTIAFWQVYQPEWLYSRQVFLLRTWACLSLLSPRTLVCWARKSLSHWCREWTTLGFSWSPRQLQCRRLGEDSVLSARESHQLLSLDRPCSHCGLVSTGWEFPTFLCGLRPL